MILSNPLGLLTLIAIPIVIAIHFLQRRAQVIPSSTLFLLQKTQKESASGRKFDRLMNSIPLWLQLLTVLLITWLVVQPRFQKANSTQRIAIVLDSSASMSVFIEETKAKLKETLPSMLNNAEQAEYWLHDSNTSKPRLYYGNSLDELLSAIDNWLPLDGANDPTHALRISRSLTGKEGALLYVTDTPKKSIPYNAFVHAIGSNIPNCGFTGISFETKDDGKTIWKTLVRNYSNESQTRTWYLENDKGQRTPEKTVTIQPKKIISLSGAIPTNSLTAKLVLSPDEFVLDDNLPLILPQPKTLFIHSSEYQPFKKLTSNITDGFVNTSIAPTIEDADAQLITQSDLKLLANNAICFNNTSISNPPYLKGNIVAEKHPLVEGLNWQSLLIREVPPIPLTDTDQVLLWQGARALIFLRKISSTKQCLVFNFDITLSNIDKSESSVVLLFRFLNKIRNAKSTHEQNITETSQPLEIITPTITPERPVTIKVQPLSFSEKEQKVITRNYTSPRKFNAPAEPGFFFITQGETKILSAANYFADTREANFSECDTDYLPASTNATTIFNHTNDDPYWRYWVLLIIAALAAAWHYTNKKSSEPSNS